MKKVVIFTTVIVTIFILIAAINTHQTKKLTDGNPYGKEVLHPETAKQLKDPNYTNIILPKKLEERIDTGKPLAVYFYSPTCHYCVQTTPIVAPMTKEMGIDMPMFNLLEFPEYLGKYKIEGTPTIVYFVGGEEVSRIVGLQEPETFKNWFSNVKK